MRSHSSIELARVRCARNSSQPPEYSCNTLTLSRLSRARRSAVYDLRARKPSLPVQVSACIWAQPSGRIVGIQARIMPHHRRELRVSIAREAHFFVGPAKQAVAELELQHQAIPAGNMLAFVKAP